MGTPTCVSRLPHIKMKNSRAIIAGATKIGDGLHEIEKYEDAPPILPCAIHALVPSVCFLLPPSLMYSASKVYIWRFCFTSPVRKRRRRRSEAQQLFQKVQSQLACWYLHLAAAIVVPLILLLKFLAWRRLMQNQTHLTRSTHCPEYGLKWRSLATEIVL